MLKRSGRVPRATAIALFAWLLWVAGFLLGAGCCGAAEPPELAAQEEAACIKNLQQIYKAIQAYQRDHHDLPNWLSDLVPQYLPDANVLICPVCRRTGKTEAPPLADPKLPCSYLFEFCPVPLGRAAPGWTRRDWKRRQMGLLGSVVPIVRCRNHRPVLNLAFDGKIYESPGMWELNFTNLISAKELTPESLFANEQPAKTPAVESVAKHFPPRAPEAEARLLDLTPFYNAMLTQTWHGFAGNIGNDLSALPEGLQTFGGTEFDVRGIVQLRSNSRSVTNYPAEISGIRVKQTCHHLYFLHSAAMGKPGENGKEIGTYVVHYAGNGMRVDIPIIYGQDVLDWHTQPNELPPGKQLKVVWTGENTVSRQAGQSIRLFLTTWTNPVPEFQVETLDFVSKMSEAAPFLIAITAD